MQLYLTPAEFRAAPHGVGTQNLVDGGTADEQDAALLEVIIRAGGWIDNFCDQPLLAGEYTETTTARVSRAGEFLIHPGRTNENVTAITALAYGARASSLSAVTDLADVWVGDGLFRVPIGAAVLGYPAIQLGRLRPGDPWIVRYTFSAGWVGTRLTAEASAGGSTVTVEDAAGIAANIAAGEGREVFTIWAGKNTERVTALGIVGNVVTIAGTLAHNHLVGDGFHNIPGELKGAAVKVTAAEITSARGSDTLSTTNALAPGPIVGQDPVGAANLRAARETLINGHHQRVR